MSFLLSITGNMCIIVGKALGELEINPTDLPIAALIINYATQIDKGNLATLSKLGPMMLQSLEALQMSPRSRAQAFKGAQNATKSGPINKLDELRQKRIERANRAKNLDSATS